MNEELIKLFQYACQQYFISFFQTNKFLYFDLIPHNYFGTDFKIQTLRCEFLWQNNPDITVDTYVGENENHGKKECLFIQYCKVYYYVKVNSIEIPNQQHQHLKFLVKSFEPFGKNVSTTIILKELEALDNFRNLKLEIKKRFKIVTISQTEFSENRIGFAYYTDVTRKVRQNINLSSELGHGNVYEEIANCHDEIQECLLNALFYQKYLSDLLGRKVKFENETLFLPNLSYMDFQYLLAISFGLDRLYSFWDRIIYVLANYESLGIKLNQVSFDKYFLTLKKKVKNNNLIRLDINSNNLKWLINFFDNEYKNITKYRHRIVHYQITPKWEGVLSSTFMSNAMEYVNKEEELKNLKIEFEGLGNLLLRQFEYCKEGFIKTLDLIDEL